MLDFEKTGEEFNQIEIALRNPTSEDLVAAGGFGTATPDNPIMRGYAEFVQAQVTDQPDYYSLGIPANEGDSGAPVVLKNGTAIGFVTRHIGKQRADFHTLMRYKDFLLSRFPIRYLEEHSGINSILNSEEPIKNRRAKLAEKLSVRDGASSVLNLEFATFLLDLRNRDGLATINYDLVLCPLHQASEKRDIGVLKFIISKYIADKEYGSFSASELYRKAAEQADLGHDSLAWTLASTAVDEYKIEVGRRLAEPAAQSALAGSIVRANAEEIYFGYSKNEFFNSSLSLDWVQNFQSFLINVSRDLGVDTVTASALHQPYVPIHKEIGSTYFPLGLKSKGSDTFAVALLDYSKALTLKAALEKRLKQVNFEREFLPYTFPSPTDSRDHEKELQYAKFANLIGVSVAFHDVWKRHNADSLKANRNSDGIVDGQVRLVDNYYQPFVGSVAKLGFD